MGNQRPRVREIGLLLGTLSTGKFNSITDVHGVKVGNETVILGDDVRTGVTAIFPHEGNVFKNKVPGAIFVGNGFGKLMGSTQVNELGEIETPIMLTNTLCVGRVADALTDYILSQPENADVASINPIVGETNDGFLNNIRNKHIGREEVFHALENTRTGPVDEGCIGAGTGTRALGFKGGIGTSSRKLSGTLDRYTVGVLVQSNFGGSLTMNGAPVGKELRDYLGKDDLETGKRSAEKDTHDSEKSGSVMVVIATDAPLEFRNLRRLAARSFLGLARTGFISQNGSGDYFISFSTAPELRIEHALTRRRQIEELRNDAMDLLFLGVVEATEEAVYNSLCRATTMKGRDNHVVEALPIDPTREILQKHGLI